MLHSVTVARLLITVIAVMLVLSTDTAMLLTAALASSQSVTCGGLATHQMLSDLSLCAAFMLKGQSIHPARTSTVQLTNTTFVGFPVGCACCGAVSQPGFHQTIFKPASSSQEGGHGKGPSAEGSQPPCHGLEQCSGWEGGAPPLLHSWGGTPRAPVRSSLPKPIMIRTH
jgi:hypothetical protein